jgi:hypothetical protein
MLDKLRAFHRLTQVAPSFENARSLQTSALEASNAANGIRNLPEFKDHGESQDLFTAINNDLIDTWAIPDYLLQ